MDGITSQGFHLLDFSHYNKPSSVVTSLPTLPLLRPQQNPEEDSIQIDTNVEEIPNANNTSTSNNKPVSNNANRKFECNVCQKSFKQLAHLNTHSLLHEGKRPHKCSYCEQTFSQLTHLKRHLVTHRSSDETRSTYSCTMCPRKFAFPSDLNAHTNKHYTRQERKSDNTTGSTRNMIANYKCGMCDKCFQYPSQLREHMYVHTHIRRFPCGDCGRRFMKEHHLKIHRQSTHQCLRPHTCHICNKTFSIKANLERHLFVHNNKTFECNVCGKRFSQPQTLKMHLISHNDIKPYQCTICGKGLARAHNLRAHMAIHRQNKPYTCHQCNATFTLKGNLQRHMKEKHAYEAQISVDDCGESQSEAVNNFADRESPHFQTQEQDTTHDGRASEDSLESEIDPVDFDSTSLDTGAASNTQQPSQQPGLFQPYANCTPVSTAPPPSHTTDLFHPLPVFSHHQHVPVHHPFYAPPPPPPHPSQIQPPPPPPSNPCPPSSHHSGADLSLPPPPHAHHHHHSMGVGVGMHGVPQHTPHHHPPPPPPPHLQLLSHDTHHNTHASHPPSHHPHHHTTHSPSVVVPQPNEMGVRLQAIHAALDEIVSQTGMSLNMHDRISAIHVAVDELISGSLPISAHHHHQPPQQLPASMLDLRSSSQIQHL